MTKTAPAQCSRCGETQAEPLNERLATAGKASIWRCTGCGGFIANSAVTTAAYLTEGKLRKGMEADAGTHRAAAEAKQNEKLIAGLETCFQKLGMPEQLRKSKPGSLSALTEVAQRMTDEALPRLRNEIEAMRRHSEENDRVINRLYAERLAGPQATRH